MNDQRQDRDAGNEHRWTKNMEQDPGIVDPQRVLIIGAGGLAREIAEAISASRRVGADILCEGMFVEPEYPTPENTAYPILSEWNDILASKAVIVIGIGDGRARERIATRLEQERANGRWGRIVHPSATIGDTVEISSGAMLIGQMSLTANILVGKHVLINPGCTIAHDCVIGAFASLSPSVALAGGVQIGDHAFLGTGAIVGPKVHVGTGAIVGAGSVVLSDVPPGAKAYGAPARVHSRPVSGPDTA